LAVNLVGFQVLARPIPIPGSPGCWLSHDLQVLTAAGLDSTGATQVTLPLPADRGLISASLFATHALVGAQVTTSQYVWTVLGGSHGVCRVHSLGTTTTTIGTPQDSVANVIRLGY
jgi:hypothetical protein